jgi:YHS domain-containing protein
MRLVNLARSAPRSFLLLALVPGLVGAAPRSSVPARALAQEQEKEKQEKKPRDLTHFNLGKKNLALQGRDPVAYFPVGGGKPKKGLETLTAVHEGVLYRFASEENRKLFLADPARYEPQYGGWCAYAMADGEKVEIDPESFLVTDGKLTLFFKSWYADTRAKWLKDEKGLKTKADKAWRTLLEPPKPK